MSCTVTFANVSKLQSCFMQCLHLPRALTSLRLCFGLPRSNRESLAEPQPDFAHVCLSLEGWTLEIQVPARGIADLASVTFLPMIP